MIQAVFYLRKGNANQEKKLKKVIIFLLIECNIP